MGQAESKCEAVCLPAQSGKTRKMQELIRTKPGEINIIISANNCLLVEQTKSRMFNDLGTKTGKNDACIKGDIFSWTSGTKEGHISASDLALNILGDEVEMVVICAHPTRLKYMMDTLDKLSKLAFQNKFTKKITIWIDEADKSIALWSKYDRQVCEMKIINNIYLVSATFTSVLSKYKGMYVHPYEKTFPDCYRGLKDMIRVEVDHIEDTACKYVESILKKDPSLKKAGMRALIPGNRETATHDAIAKFLYDEGFIVLILNGKRKEILIPDQEPIDMRSHLTVAEDDSIPTELNTQLATLYTTNDWSRFPFAVTGCECISRGITFQCGPVDGHHEGFLFDYGIIQPNPSAAESTQSMGRMFGNVGDFPNYTQPKVYANSATFKRVEQQEEIARNIARMVYERDDSENHFVDKNDFKAAQNSSQDKEFELKHEEFNTLEDANAFMSANNARQKKLKKEGEFYKSSTTSTLSVMSYEKVKKDMCGWKKTSGFDIKKKPGTSTFGRMFICYKDLEDPKSVVFICRVLKRV